MLVDGPDLTTTTQREARQIQLQREAPGERTGQSSSTLILTLMLNSPVGNVGVHEASINLCSRIGYTFRFGLVVVPNIHPQFSRR